MDEQPNGAIFACDKAKVRYDASSGGICPVHGDELTVVYPPNLIPEFTDFNACPRCGSESTPATRTDRGKIGTLITDTPHCPDCGSTRQERLVGRRPLTDAETAVITERNETRRADYERVARYKPAKGSD